MKSTYSFEMATNFQLATDENFNQKLDNVKTVANDKGITLTANAPQNISVLYIKTPTITKLNDDIRVMDALPDYSTKYYTDNKAGVSCMSIFVDMKNMPVIPRTISITSEKLDKELSCAASGHSYNDAGLITSAEYRYILPDGFKLDDSCKFKLIGALTTIDPVVVKININ